MIHKTDILILGAGIGGYEAFRTLDRLLNWHALGKTITIVDEHNYFTFTPLLHEVASGSVEPSHATFSLRELVYKTRHQFLKATVKQILPEEKKVVTSAGTVSYDYCVMALGSGVHFFNVTGAEKFSHTIRTLPKAMALREHIITQLEQEPKTLTMTIVGGGFSGVEVAGQMAYFRQHSLSKLYPKTKVTIQVVEASATVTPVLPLRAQKKIIRQLEKLDVKLLLNQRVEEVKKNTILLASGEILQSNVTIWCSGIHNLADCFMHEDDCEKQRFPVTHTLNHEKFPSLYGVGDIVLGYNKNSTIPYPQLGEAAHKQGEYVARHIVASLRKKKIKDFVFKSKGTLMPIGERYAVVIIGKLVFSGLFAWWLRRTVYIAFMPGFMRKLKLIIYWTLHLFGFSYIIDLERK